MVHNLTLGFPLLKTFLLQCLADIPILLLFRYGDRAPKSFLARIFCIVWILVGIIIIAIFTAIVTASLSASIQHHFTVHGSVVSYEWNMISWIIWRPGEAKCLLSLVVFIHATMILVMKITQTIFILKRLVMHVCKKSFDFSWFKTFKARNVDKVCINVLKLLIVPFVISIICVNRLYLQIGAVNGSEEFRLGVSLNADMKRKNMLARMKVHRELTDRLTDPLSKCLTDWLTSCLPACLPVRLSDRLSDWLSDSPNDWLTVWLTVWLSDWIW